MSLTERQSTRSFDKALRMGKAAEMVMLRGLKAGEAARQLHTTRTNVFGLLKTAREEGVLGITVDLRKFIHPMILYQPAIDLEDRYRQLEKAEVVELPSQLSSPGKFNPILDDLLQRELAESGYLRGLIRAGDSLGISGDPTSRYLAEDFLGIGYPRIDCRVVPLGMDRTGSRTDFYKAQLAAGTLATAIGGSIGSSAEKLDIAVIGIENPSLRTDYFAAYQGRRVPEDLAIALSELKSELQDFVNQAGETPSFHPLMDVLQRIEVIDPPESLQHLMPESRVRKLRALAEVLNQGTDSAGLDIFRQSDIRIAIAGGLHRTYQIWAAIKMGYINRLVTDKLTAEALIKLADGENPFITDESIKVSRARTPVKAVLTTTEAAFLEEAQRYALEHPDKKSVNLAAIARNLDYTRAAASLIYERVSKKTDNLPPKQIRKK